MKLKLTGALAVLVLAGGIVAWREAHRNRATEPEPSPAGATRVVLFVDLSEVGEEEGCGAIIRAVRDARKRGVATEEVDTRDPGDRAKRYRLLVAPAVVVLDGSGRELKRLEGESSDTVRAIRAELDRLAPGR
jgi:sugar/nucleoside kinase (ribokinase family)